MNLIVGCPIKDRAWIIPDWFEYMHAACEAAGIDDPHVVFVGDPETDPHTFNAIVNEVLHHNLVVSYVKVPGDGEPYFRDWTPDRYDHMVELRNTLLHHVRELVPDLFWSLDSDILPAESALKSALELIDRFDAVGMRCFMTAGGDLSCPSFGMLSEGGLVRRDQPEGNFPCDVIMATKLMTPKAYRVDYSAHAQGEDVGWSINARAAGCTLGWDGRSSSKHVMSPVELFVVDPRVGF